ncbi:hypothetical protein FACS189418_0920 [Clostridia bacterium]|nr:hypothetical protein FACS189418_0920 [Clostridia bacterium]
MKRDFRLNDQNMLDKEHFPVQAIFNMVSDERFIQIIEGISEGKGFGENFGACIFPDDLDEYDIATGGIFEGVEFGLHNGEEVVINYETLYKYLQIICLTFIEDYPDKRETLNKLLNKYKQKYHIE